MDTGLANRALAASFVVAWQAAQARIKGRAELELEAAAQLCEWAKPIAQTDYMAMRQAFALKFGEPEDKHVPAKEYIERKLHELETGEFRAEPLSEVLSRDEIHPETLVPQWDSKGTIVLKKASSKGALPANPEQLRLRLTVMASALLMIQLHHPGRVEVADTNQQLFEKYKDYLLGDYCYGLRSNEASRSLAPPWTLVLSCERAIRKFAYKQMATLSIGFADALALAWRDAATKERHFTTPLSLRNKRPQPWNRVTPQETASKGNGKGRGSKGKAKNKKQKTGKEREGYSRTSDGKPICYRYNAKNGCKKGDKCHFVHVCTKCLGEHPATKCTQAKPDQSASAG